MTKFLAATFLLAGLGALPALAQTTQGPASSGGSQPAPPGAPKDSQASQAGLSTAAPPSCGGAQPTTPGGCATKPASAPAASGC